MPQSDPLQEALDPTTDPERLRELARHKDEDVRRASWRNPSLPEDVWREVALESEPEAWDNPMAPFYLLAWTPSNKNSFNLEFVTRWAMEALWEAPDRCSTEGKALINAKIQEGWATSEVAGEMIQILGWWAMAKGRKSAEHRKTVHITVLCVQTAPNLTTEDRQALDLLEIWSEGGKDQRKKADALASSQAVMETVKFSKDPGYNPRNAIFEVLEAVEDTAGTQARVEHNRLMAELIRREMPLPPVVE